MQYIIEFNNNQSLLFDVYDNNIVNMHTTLLNSIKGNKEFRGHGVFSTYDTVTDPHNRILQAKKQLKEMDIDITWPADENEITREILNELHLDFHKVTENNELPVDAAAIFNIINYDIHQLEKLIMQQGSYTHYVIKAKEFGKQYPPRIAIDTSKYIDYFKARYIENMPNTMLYLGYTTIGKHLFHCVLDNDIEAIVSGHLAPQTTMSTEVVVRHQPPMDSYQNQEGINQYNKSCEEQIIRWVHDKVLLNYVDLDDERNFIHEQPILGQICEEQRNITEYELWQLFRNLTIIDTRYVNNATSNNIMEIL